MPRCHGPRVLASTWQGSRFQCRVGPASERLILHYVEKAGVRTYNFRGGATAMDEARLPKQTVPRTDRRLDYGLYPERQTARALLQFVILYAALYAAFGMLS